MKTKKQAQELGQCCSTIRQWTINRGDGLFQQLILSGKPHLATLQRTASAEAGSSPGDAAPPPPERARPGGTATCSPTGSAGWGQRHPEKEKTQCEPTFKKNPVMLQLQPFLRRIKFPPFQTLFFFLFFEKQALKNAFKYISLNFLVIAFPL